VEIIFAVAALVFSWTLAAMIGRAGWIKTFTPIPTLAGSGLVWVSEIPRAGVRAIGVLELFAALVLFVAPVAQFTPVSSPAVTLGGVAAAVGVALLMAAAHFFHLRRGEASYTWQTNFAFGALAVLSASSQFVAV
jgi:hypothetical protein